MFMLPFNDSNIKDGYNNDFENSPKLDKEAKLDLNKEILLFKDNNPNPNSKLKEGTSFINIEEYLAKMALIEPLKLPFIKIPNLLFKTSALYTLKLANYYNNSIRIQALTLL
jgi:hypothetical protein